MHVRVAGVRWRVTDEAIDGVCDHDSNTVSVDPHQRRRKRLDTLVHEMLHATRPEMGEENVAAVAKVLTTVLWKDGWRWGRRRRRRRQR